MGSKRLQNLFFRQTLVDRDDRVSVTMIVIEIVIIFVFPEQKGAKNMR